MAQESEAFSIVVAKVVLPNGQVKTNVDLDTESTVKEEKERILREAHIPNPNRYVMVVHDPNQSRKVLDDFQTVESYADVIGGGLEHEIHIEDKSSLADPPPIPPINTQQLNVNFKI